jgi:orotate phosphoribosyltransferase
MDDILRMDKEELLRLRPKDLSLRLFTAPEMLHIARAFGALWTYDYLAAKEGRVGMHALLRSGLHSDGFFVSRILLELKNIRRILSHQMVMRIWETNTMPPNYVAGVPNGATVLGSEMAYILGTHNANMEKIEGRMALTTDIPDGATLLIVEDLCTRGTALREAVLQVRSRYRFVSLVPYFPVLINRGGLQEISIDGVGRFRILPIVERTIQDWNPNQHCPLCDLGSTAIQPKATTENWWLLTTSQLQ